MTESEWLIWEDPRPMLVFLMGRASDRKLQLFACACRWRKNDDGSYRYGDEPRGGEAGMLAAVDLGLTSERFNLLLFQKALVPRAFLGPVLVASDARHVERHRHGWVDEEEERERQAALLHDIFGNPFRPVTLDPLAHPLRRVTRPKPFTTSGPSTACRT